MKKKEVCKEKGENSKQERNCYDLKKHPSATFVPYQPRVCPDPDKYKKKCPPPIEVCKDPDAVDLCAKKKRRQAAALTIDDVDIKVIPREKPPRCPPKDNPCANDGVVKPQVCKVEETSCGEQDDD